MSEDVRYKNKSSSKICRRSYSGSGNPFFGKHHSLQTRKLISSSQGKIWEDQTCGVCSKIFHVKPYKIKNGRGKFCSKVCSSFGKIVYYDEKHHFWKGNNVGYSALHAWIRRKLGSPLKCDNCGKEDDKIRSYHWASILHKYSRDLSEWMRLCVSCHSKYDKSNLHI